MGCRPRARSVLRCHGVLVLRHGPPREHGQAGRWPMKGGQSPSLELVSREFRKQRLEPWAAGRGPDPSFAAMVFWCCDTVLQEAGKVSKRTRASWQVADEGRAKSKFGASF